MEVAPALQPAFLTGPRGGELVFTAISAKLLLIPGRT
jgi:hypothetical protein